MVFKSGYDLEDAIFGRHSSGEKLVEKFWGQRPDFDEDVKALIRDSYARCPETRIGELFWLETKRELDRLGVDHYGLVFLSAIDTKVDLRHFADGVFFLPSVPRFPVTIDTFNLDPGVQKALKDSWVDSFEGSAYTSSDFQSDLFRYKLGLTKWKKDCQKLSETGLTIVQPKDFRAYTSFGRPENHFIMTPYHIGVCRRRREFAKMVARYLLKVSCQNTAQLSH